MFVRGFGSDCTTRDLMTQFNWDRIIVDIHIPRVRSVSCGFNFIRFKEEDMEYLLKLNPDIKVGGKKMFFARARKQGFVGAKGKPPVVMLDLMGISIHVVNLQ